MCDYFKENKCVANKDKDFCPKNIDKFEISHKICPIIYNPKRK